MFSQQQQEMKVEETGELFADRKKTGKGVPFHPVSFCEINS